MTFRVGIFLVVAFLMSGNAQANGFPCFPDAALDEVQAPVDMRGYGISNDTTLVRLSVDYDGNFLVTVKIPNTPVFCVIAIGENWEWIIPKSPTQEAEKSDS